MNEDNRIKLWTPIKHFKIEEFDSPDMPKSGINMDINFILLLDKIRGLCNFPFKVTSGYRTPAHNLLVGGRDGSSHKSGLAVDIWCETSRERFFIVKNALDCGIKRIGIAHKFLHLDYSLDLDQEVFWLYEKCKCIF